MLDLATNLLTEICLSALPIAIVFEIANLIIGTFLRTAFGGKLWFGK